MDPFFLEVHKAGRQPFCRGVFGMEGIYMWRSSLGSKRRHNEDGLEEADDTAFGYDDTDLTWRCRCEREHE
jgi:hypothetical protein